MRTVSGLIVGMSFLLAASALFAQGESSAARVAQYREEQRAIHELEGQIPSPQRTSWDWGGWYRFSFTSFDDFHKDRRVVDHDLRIWGSLSIQDIHQFYVRGRIQFVDWNHGDSFDGNDEDVVGPNLDQGWYSFDLTNFLQRHGGHECFLHSRFKVGRQYIEVGHGIVLSEIMDAVAGQFDVQPVGGQNWFSTRVFAGMRVESMTNLDASAPKYWHDERYFFGTEVRLTCFDRHTPYAYALFVKDKNDYHQVYDDTLLFYDADGDPIIQGYGYNPNYYGFGSEGYIIPNLRYWGEVIFEGGHSRARGTRKQDDIDAMGVVAGAEYLFNDVPLRPRVEAEYALGSGDPDRMSPTNTVNGNLPGTRDRGFLPYGYVDTGVAFAPRLANLHVVRVTGSCHPLDFVDKPCLKNLETGASFYWFTKDERTGGITDWRANRRRFGLGTELDLFANWRLTSDLLWTIRWGQFYPGDAFSDHATRGYLFTSLTYSF